MKNQHGFVIPLLITLVALLVLCGGVYVYSTQNRDVNLASSINTQATSSSATHEEAQNTTTEKASGYIKSAYLKNNLRYIDIDYITFRHQAGDMPWGTIINDNSKIRTFEVALDAKISIRNIKHNTADENENISFGEFEKIVSNKNDLRAIDPWDIVVENGYVVGITEIFRS